MSNPNIRTRRAFFLQGGAALGAGIAATAAPAREDTSAADLAAIRRLHRDFLAALETGRFAAAAAFFSDDARLDLSGACAVGRRAIDSLFIVQYAERVAPMLHGAHRQSALHPQDVVTLCADRRRATATFHTEAELIRPLPADSAIARMARLQGLVAERRRESGRFEVNYARSPKGWQMTALDYFSI